MHDFTAGFFFCGLGAGARGFLDAVARLGPEKARFVNAGGIDLDPLACQDFEYLTGGRALEADMSTLTPEDLRAFMGPTAPDAIFASPPCKGFSGLLGKEAAAGAKYQELNRLVLQGMFLACESWPTPPKVLIFENVPLVVRRGAELLRQVRQLLAQYGYVFSEAMHNCGEVGGLAQNRRRYLLVARQAEQVPNYIYRPAKKRVRGCGEVLGTLPMPEDPAAGPHHKLPKISPLNYLRLALIPAGGDWRDLPTGDDAGAIPLQQTAAAAGSFKGRPGLFGVNDWSEPVPAVTGSASVSGSNAVAAVADPRVPGPGAVAVNCRKNRFSNQYKMRHWGEPAGSVTGDTDVQEGAQAVADPRIPLDYEPRRGTFGVVAWKQPAPTVRGVSTVRNGGCAVADPRRFALPARNEGRHENKYAVIRWGQPSRTVIGATRPGSGALNVSDPRVEGLRVARWMPSGDVMTLEAAVAWIDAAVGGSSSARRRDGWFPVILAEDGTWHRPMTTLELAVLQGLPVMVAGKPLQLAGKSNGKHRERIGNAVPVGAGMAIAESLLVALVAAKLGTWTLGSTGIWVRQDGAEEDVVNAPYEAEDPVYA